MGRGEALDKSRREDRRCGGALDAAVEQYQGRSGGKADVGDALNPAFQRSRLVAAHAAGARPQTRESIEVALQRLQIGVFTAVGRCHLDREGAVDVGGRRFSPKGADPLETHQCGGRLAPAGTGRCALSGSGWSGRSVQIRREHHLDLVEIGFVHSVRSFGGQPLVRVRGRGNEVRNIHLDERGVLVLDHSAAPRWSVFAMPEPEGRCVDGWVLSRVVSPGHAIARPSRARLRQYLVGIGGGLVAGRRGAARPCGGLLRNVLDWRDRVPGKADLVFVFVEIDLRGWYGSQIVVDDAGLGLCIVRIAGHWVRRPFIGGSLLLGASL